MKLNRMKKGSLIGCVDLITAVVLFSSASLGHCGVVVAWATNASSGPNYEVSRVPAGLTNVMAIAAGSRHSLALCEDGTVVAWGNNYVGQTNVPRGLRNVIAIAAGGEFGNLGGQSIALRNDGTVVAWGHSAQTNVPAGLSNVVAIATGMEQVLALKSDGTVVAWGNNWLGLTNVPSFVTNAVAIAAGASHCLALTANGTVIGWGANNYGQVTGVSTYPDNVITNGWVSIDGALLSNVVAIVAGDQHSLALRSDGTAVAWGYNGYGETNVPAGLGDVIAIGQGGSEGVFDCLALKKDGTLVAWGSNSYGQTDVPLGLSNVVAVSTGSALSLALVANVPPLGAAPLTPLKWDSDGFSLSLPSESGRVYTLEYIDSLTDDRWISLPLVAGNGHTLILTDPTATNSPRFYRVRRW